MKNPRIAVLLSGSGRTLQNFLDRIVAAAMPGRVVDVIASHSRAFGLERARRAGLPHAVIDPRAGGPPGAFRERLHGRLRDQGVDLVLLAGYLVRFPMSPEWAGRVMNIHPALLPGVGGQGFYGLRVHEAVLASGAAESGCTVHFVDDHYDHGPIILQRRVPVHPDDTPESLAARVFAEELAAYPEAVRLFAEGRLRLVGDRVVIVPAPPLEPET
ncbi:MAG: phosphoribosylglycinamide formyltransferase [Planctomycetes bacterium]|nr:phosphoribosylglycinamide formyltransferase [Planctomycetota bacterium]